MVKSTIAIITAAGIAGALVAFVPPPRSAIAASEIDFPSLAVAAVAAAPIPLADTRTDVSSCTRAWPYYEQSCLHNNRPSNGTARVVRVIADDTSVASRASKPRR
jgi:hypothetical protein